MNTIIDYGQTHLQRVKRTLTDMYSVYGYTSATWVINVFQRVMYGRSLTTPSNVFHKRIMYKQTKSSLDWVPRIQTTWPFVRFYKREWSGMVIAPEKGPALDDEAWQIWESAGSPSDQEFLYVGLRETDTDVNYNVTHVVNELLPRIRGKDSGVKDVTDILPIILTSHGIRYTPASLIEIHLLCHSLESRIVSGTDAIDCLFIDSLK